MFSSCNKLKLVVGGLLREEECKNKADTAQSKYCKTTASKKERGQSRTEHCAPPNEIFKRKKHARNPNNVTLKRNVYMCFVTEWCNI